MPIENKFVRCESDDPNRCQASGANGQCPYKAETGFKYCPRHNGGHAKRDEQKRMRNLRLTKYQARMEEKADNESIKSLREEIGVTRIVLEEIVNACNDGQEIIMASNKISEIVCRIERLVTSCHKLEQSSGLLLDQATLLKLADTIVEIIGSKIDNEDTVREIANEIVGAIVGSQENESEEDIR